MQEAKLLHASIITRGLHQREFHLRNLFSLFAAAGPDSPSSLAHALLVLRQTHWPSAFLYNTLFRAYAASPHPLRALSLYRHMRRRGAPSPDLYTFPFLLKASSALSDLPLGEQIHCHALKHGLDSDLYVQNALLYLYGSNSKVSVAQRVFQETGRRDIASWTTMVTLQAEFGLVDSAREVFDEMPERSAVSYSAMIAGYVRKNRFKEALGLFGELVNTKVDPNDSTITSVLVACANLGALDVGRWVHSYIRQRKGSNFDSRITTALIDMYFKCGNVADAMSVFRGAKEKYVGEWTALLSGLAMHGLGRHVVDAFEDMVSRGVKPNAVTFVALLTGCTHSGFVSEGLSYLNRMRIDYGVDPSIEHFGCVVDLLGRAGLIDQAMKFIRRMPVEANAAIWGAVLNACRVYKNVEVGEIAAKWLINDEPQNAAIYMTLLGLYKGAKRLEEVEKVKIEMKKVGCRKSPGCSLVEVNGICYEFVVGDNSHLSALEMCKNINKVSVEFKDYQ